MAKRGAPTRLRVSNATFKRLQSEIDSAIDTADLDIRTLASRLCSRHSHPCQDDPYMFSGRAWVYRALYPISVGKNGRAAYMTHRHAYCLLWRAYKLGAIGWQRYRQLKGLVTDDEHPNTTPAFMAVYPGAAEPIAAEVADVVRAALPAIGKGGKKEADLISALRRYFKTKEVDDGQLWYRWSGGS